MRRGIWDFSDEEPTTEVDVVPMSEMVMQPSAPVRSRTRTLTPVLGSRGGEPTVMVFDGDERTLQLQGEEDG